MSTLINTPPAVKKDDGMPKSEITIEELKDILPSHLKSSASPEMVKRINTITNDPIEAENLKQNFVSFTSVLTQGKFKVEDYLNAISYVSFKLMGHSNQEAYRYTFPKRYDTLIAQGKSAKDISSYVAGYHKNKLVTLILEQSLVPVWLTNQDILQRAINTQAELMLTAQSEKVRSDAANSIMTHLKPPEVKEMSLDINVREPEGTRELKGLMQQLAEKQAAALSGGEMTTRQIAEQKIIDGTYTESDK